MTKLYGSAQSGKYPQVEFVGLPTPFSMVYQVADLAAGADIAATGIFVVPAGKKLILQSVNIVAQGSTVGVDASNTCLVVVKDGSTVVATKEFSNTVAFPDAGAAAAITMSAEAVFTAGDVVTYAVTNGATANPPGFTLQLNGILTDA
jgi:hypothetical protein